jgi:hypothetical protein
MVSARGRVNDDAAGVRVGLYLPSPGRMKLGSNIIVDGGDGVRMNQARGSSFPLVTRSFITD